MRQLDIIIPCYNEQECVRSIYKTIKCVMDTVSDWRYTVCYVDDGSRDDTLATIEALVHEGEPVKYISFSRNFGKEAAIYAGLQSSRGDAIVFMDADHQDPPALLPVMLQGLDEGFDTVSARRTDRKNESPVRSWFANQFYALINKLSDVAIEPGARDYRVMTAQVRDALLSMNEYERFSKGLFAWVGFKTKWLEMENVTRKAGTTKWSFWGLFKYAVSGIVAFTTTPLRLSSLIGFFTVLIGITYLIYRVIRYRFLVTTDAITIVLVLLIGGVIIMLLGVIGEYLARIYSEVKRRPIYIVKKQNMSTERGEQY